MTTTIEFGKENFHLQGEMINWCDKYIGKNPPHSDWVWQKPNEWEGLGKWSIQSAFGNTFFYFKEEKDAALFALRWL